VQDLDKVRLVVVPAEAVRLTHLAAAGHRRRGAAHLLVAFLALRFAIPVVLLRLPGIALAHPRMVVLVVVEVRWLVGLLVRSGIAVVIHTVQAGEGGAQQRGRVEG